MGKSLEKRLTLYQKEKNLRPNKVITRQDHRLPIQSANERGYTHLIPGIPRLYSKILLITHTIVKLFGKKMELL